MHRVGVDAHVLTGKFQGSRTWLHNVLANIDDLAPMDQYVVYSDDPARVAGMVGAEALEHRLLPHRPAPIRLLASWPKVAARDHLDVLITQYNAPPLGAGRQVVVVHDILFETHPDFFPQRMRYRLQAMTRLSVRRAALVVTVSDYSRQQIIDRYRVPAEQIIVCRNAVDGATFERGQTDRPSSPEPPYLLVVGRIEPRKNIDLVLRATEKIRHQGVQLILVGSSDFSAEHTLRAMAEADNVVHLTGVPDTHLAGLYRGAAALVFASSGEGFGLPVLEALSYGTPVIASDRTSIPEVGGDFADYFNPDEPDADQVLSALVDDVLRHPPGHDAAALTRHLAEFDWRRSATDLVTAVHRVAR